MCPEGQYCYKPKPSLGTCDDCYKDCRLQNRQAGHTNKFGRETGVRLFCNVSSAISRKAKIHFCDKKGTRIFV